MLYLTKEAGEAVGTLIKVSGGTAEVRLTSDEMIITISANEKVKPATEEQPKKRATGPVTWGGETLTVKEWAAKLGVAPQTIHYRIKAYGNPIGSKGPDPDTDTMVVAGE